MLVSNESPGPLTLATSESWKPSVFRPPSRFLRASLPPKSVLTATARPWYPKGNNSNPPRERERERPPRPVPPPALGQSPPNSPRPVLPPSLDGAFLAPTSSCSSFSPLTTPVSVCYHSFTEEACAERVYPHDMFMSVRRNAAHTPHGVLLWAVRKYLEIPTLKVPTHLQLSLHEAAAPEDGVTRGALGSSLKGRTRAKPVRLTHHKMMSILSRLAPQKYDALRDEMMLLPLRQVDDAELMEICRIVFEKAVQEPTYSGLYARLARDITSIRDVEREVPERTFSRRFRRQLIAYCEEQFQRPLQMSQDDLVDRTTGKPLRSEEVEMKRGRLKNRLVGNIRFVAELFNMGVITERVIEDIVRILVGNYDPQDPTAKEEYLFEVFVTLVRHTAANLLKTLPFLVAKALGIAKTIQNSHPKPRVRFLMMDLEDLNTKQKWVPADMVQQFVRECPSSSPSLSSTTATTNPNANAAVQTPPAGVTKVSTGNATAFTPRVEKITGSSAPKAEPTSLLNSQNSSSNNSNGNSESCAAWRRSTASSTPNASVCVSAPIPVSASASLSAPAPSAVTTTAKTTTTTTTIARAVTTAAARAAKHASASNSFDREERRCSQNQPYCKLVLTPLTDFSPSSRNASFVLNSPMSPPRAYSDTAMMYSMPRYRVGEAVLSRPASEGLPSPWAAPRSSVTPVNGTVDMREVAKQLMASFRGTGDSEDDVVAMRLREMGLKSMVLCLTWWMRLVATNTALFEDRSRIPALFSSLLRNGVCDAQCLFSTLLEWLRFDMENAEYDECPRMFDNLAQMILQCHQPCNSSLPRMATVRTVMQCAVMGAVLRDLSLSDGVGSMVTVVKSCHPVSQQVLSLLCDASGDGEALTLRDAALNRFRLLPCLMAANASGGAALSPHSLCGSPGGDSFSSAGHYDPLAQCLVFPRISEDAEFVLFRRLRDGIGAEAASHPPRWLEEVVYAALTPLGCNSATCQLIAVMRAVGAACAALCTNHAFHQTNSSGGLNQSKSGMRGAAPLVLDDVVAGILSNRPKPLFQAAAVLELIVLFTQTPSVFDASYSNGGVGLGTRQARMAGLRQTFGRWCARGIVHAGHVMRLLESLNGVGDDGVFAALHAHMTETTWGETLAELQRGM